MDPPVRRRMQPPGGMPPPPPYGGYAGSMFQGWAMTPPPIPRPRGIPSRSLFITGAVGSFLAAGAALPFSFFSPFGLGFFFFGSATLVAIGAAVLMSVGLVLHLIGMYGFW